MPRLSELPTNNELTGDESIVIVQVGVTRKVALSNALIAHHPVSFGHARWVQSSDNLSTFIDSSTLELSLSTSGGC